MNRCGCILYASADPFSCSGGRETLRREKWGPAIDHIRILVVGVSSLAADLLEQAVRPQDDMRVVGTDPDPDRLLELARATRPDVVFVGQPDASLPERCLDLLKQHPTVKVLGLSQASGCTHLHELQLRHTRLCDLAPAGVVETIRAVMRRQPD